MIAMGGWTVGVAENEIPTIVMPPITIITNGSNIVDIVMSVLTFVAIIVALYTSSVGSRNADRRQKDEWGQRDTERLGLQIKIMEGLYQELNFSALMINRIVLDPSAAAKGEIKLSVERPIFASLGGQITGLPATAITAICLWQKTFEQDIGVLEHTIAHGRCTRRPVDDNNAAKIRQDARDQEQHEAKVEKAALKALGHCGQYLAALSATSIDERLTADQVFALLEIDWPFT